MAGEKKDAKKVAKKATKKVAEVTETGADAAKGAIDAVGNLVGGIGKKAKAAAGKVEIIAGDVAEGAAKKAKGAAKKAKAAAAAAADKVEDIAGDALSAAKGAATKAADVVGDVAQDAMGAAKGVADKVEDIAEGALDAAGDLGKKGIGAAMGVIGGAAAMAGGLGNSLKEAAEKTIDAAGELAEGAVDAAKGAAVKVGDVAEDAMGAAKGAADAVADGTSDALNAAASEKGGLLVPSLIGIAAIIGLAWFGLKMSEKSKPIETLTEATMPSVPAWFGEIGNKLKSEFPWLKLEFKNGQILASGEAKDKNAKDAALGAVNLEIEASEAKGSTVLDNITIQGSGEKPLGAALSALGENPDAAACGAAFKETMAGRTINFEIGKAAISNDSSALLSALTGIATACKAHKIEIGGHTDSQGDDAANQTLSQSRADAVKAFWVERGVPADGLVAVGYGETKPLDTAENEAAFAKNRRTEFTVK